MELIVCSEQVRRLLLPPPVAAEEDPTRVALRLEVAAVERLDMNLAVSALLFPLPKVTMAAKAAERPPVGLAGAVEVVLARSASTP
jgi:hypothetical protein